MIYYVVPINPLVSGEKKLFLTKEKALAHMEKIPNQDELKEFIKKGYDKEGKLESLIEKYHGL